MTRTSFKIKRHYLIAFCCILVGCIVLIPVAQNSIRYQTQKILNRYAIHVDWQSMHWTWNGVCLEQLILHKNQQGFKAKVPQVCARLSFQLQWPPVAIRHLQFYDAKMTLYLDQLSKQKQSNHSHQTKHFSPSPTLSHQIKRILYEAFDVFQQSMKRLEDLQLSWSNTRLDIKSKNITITSLTAEGKLTLDSFQSHIQGVVLDHYTLPSSHWYFRNHLLQVMTEKSHVISNQRSKQSHWMGFEQFTLTPQKLSIKNYQWIWKQLFHLQGDIDFNLIQNQMTLNSPSLTLASPQKDKHIQANHLLTSWRSSISWIKHDQTNFLSGKNELISIFNQFKSLIPRPSSKVKTGDHSTQNLQSKMSQWLKDLTVMIDGLTLFTTDKNELLPHLKSKPRTQMTLLPQLRSIDLNKEQSKMYSTFNFIKQNANIKLQSHMMKYLEEISWSQIDLAEWRHDLEVVFPILQKHHLRGKTQGRIILNKQRDRYLTQIQLEQAYLHSSLLKQELGPFKIKLDTTLQSHNKKYTLDPLLLSFQDLDIRGTGKLIQQSQKKKIKLEVAVKQQACQKAFMSIPKSVRSMIKDIRLTGDFKPSLKLTFTWGTGLPSNIQFSLKKFLHQCHVNHLSFILDQEPTVHIKGHKIKVQNVLWLKEAFVYTIDPSLTQGKSIRVGPGSKQYIPIKEIPAYVGAAMYLTEEMGFWRGGALSPTLIQKAINTNLKGGKFVYGGSTIIQQLVKNLFLSREKSIQRKVNEVIISAAVLDQLSKNKILELYLNCIEFAPKVFGIAAAAHYYFQKDARALNVQEAIFLAMLKVAPWRGPRWIRRGYSPTFTWWKNRSVEVLNRLLTKGQITKKQANNKAPFMIQWKDKKYQGIKVLTD